MVKSEQKRWLWAVFAGLLASYLLLLTKNYYWDGIFFAQTIEAAPSLDASLLHPNHLVYNLLGYLAYRGARSVGLQLRAVEVLQILNCFVSVLSAYVLFRILSECFKSTYLSVVLTLLFAFSATWWKFSTDADSYIPSVLFLLLSFYLILPGRRPRPFLLAVTFSFSMLFHQLAIICFPVFLLGVILQTTPQSPIRRLLPGLKFAFSAFLITFPLFYWSFYLVTGSMAFKPFVHWVTTFSPEHGFTFDAWDNLVYTLRGHSRLFVGGRLSFLRDLNSPLMIALASVVLIVGVVFFINVFRHLKELKTAFKMAFEANGRLRTLRILCGVWIACYLIFLFFFIPQNTFYRLFYLPAIIVLVGTFLAPFEIAPNRIRRYRAALFVGLVLVANLTYSAYPYAQVRANPPLALALKMNEVWTPRTIVYFAKWNSDNSLVRYFNSSVVWKEANCETIQREIPNLQKSGERAWIETTLIEDCRSTAEGTSWVELHTIRRPEFELVNNKYKLQFYEIILGSF